MKILIALFIILLTLSKNLLGQNIGIGTSTPQAKLHIVNSYRVGGALKFIQYDSTSGNFNLNQSNLNINNGALKINGSEGNPGQMLQSNGNASSPSWNSPTNLLYNNIVNVETTNSVLVTDTDPNTPIPGLSYSFTLSGNAKVLVSFNIIISTASCIVCVGSTRAEVLGYVNNAYSFGALQQIEVNGRYVTITGSRLLALGPGTYTIDMKANTFGPDITYGGGLYDSMIIQIIPQ